MIKWRAREYSGENHPRWKDNDDYYCGPNWARQRRKTHDRDGHECQHCGSEDQLQVHHIVPYESFDDHQEANRLSNLITLCVSCHHRVEWGSLIVQSVERVLGIVIGHLATVNRHRMAARSP
ncbi:HNH endonuclease [Halorubrum californiense]|uniref:HNH endonuclease n=1 Tax=Halorubrum californiense TaxID=416585 RepID=UPI0009B5A62F